MRKYNQVPIGYLYGNNIGLHDQRKCLLGIIQRMENPPSYHFRFKVRFTPDASFWMVTTHPLWMAGEWHNRLGGYIPPISTVSKSG
jgi:hypothetical protein